jgi:outer membrane protein OmpA-like peptidoglycan-associated protein
LYSVNTADSNTADCSVNASTGVITYFAAGVCTIDASAAATSTYTAGFAELTFNVTSLVIPTMSWSPSPSSTPVSPSGTTITPAPTTDSPGAITYAIASTNDTAGCTLASSSAPIVLMSSAQGVCSITATVAASGSYAAETITAPFAILATATLSWAPSPTSFTTAQSPRTIVGVTTNSDGVITYAIDGSADTAGCTLTSSSAPVILHFTTAGGCTVDASVAASTTFAAAAISQAFTTTTPPPSSITQSAPFANASPDTASQSFSDQVVTTGQSGTVTFSASGSLPAGVSVSSSGLIASNGTTPSGVYTLSGTDSDTSSDSGTWIYVLTVRPAGGTITQTHASGSVNAGNPFTDTVTTSGSDGAVTYTTTSSGNAFTVNSSGAVSAPDTLVPGSYTVSGTDVDAFGNAGNWTYTLIVTAAAARHDAIVEGTSVASVNAGAAFTGTITTTGNDGAVTFSTSAGGSFTVSSSGGISASSSLKPGVYALSGTDADGHGDTGVWTFTLTVVAPSPTISVAPAASGAVGQTYIPVVVSSGSTVTITSSTPAICRVRNGVVTYLASGTCTLSFATRASVDYAAATTVTQRITVRVPARVHLTLFDFANDEWALTSSMLNRLNVLARTIMRDDDTHISISGYASSTGGAAHNDLLSRNRAAVVTKYLLAGLKHDGATVAALRSLGHGAANFVSPDSAAAANRRVSVYAW